MATGIYSRKGAELAKLAVILEDCLRRGSGSVAACGEVILNLVVALFKLHNDNAVDI
jgi:hypothetical protein